jgi:hypothetical protein
MKLQTQAQKVLSEYENLPFSNPMIAGYNASAVKICTA